MRLLKHGISLAMPGYLQGSVRRVARMRWAPPIRSAIPITLAIPIGLAIPVSLGLILILSGCHSAMFQTAKIREGVDGTFGVTRARGAEESRGSDYSFYARGEIGRAARKTRFGYSFGLTFIGPFENPYKDFSGEQEWESGTFPNEAIGILPELKLQFPRKIPVDFAIDVRFMTILPERIALLASQDASDWLTFYQSYAFTGTEGSLLCLGVEVSVSRTVSFLVERTQWLSEHDYPNDYNDPVRAHPYSFGLALSYHVPRTEKSHDPRDLAMESEPGN